MRWIRLPWSGDSNKRFLFWDGKKLCVVSDHVAPLLLLHVGESPVEVGCLDQHRVVDGHIQQAGIANVVYHPGYAFSVLVDAFNDLFGEKRLFIAAKHVANISSKP